MNERIRELAEQAGFQSNPLKGFIHLPGLNPTANVQLEKFAELIVQECALVATQQFTGYTYPVDVAGYVTAGKVQSARMIKQHFGIE